MIKEKIDNSSFILLILSDTYFINEWSNRDFTNYINSVVNKVPKTKYEKTQLICVQLHDVSDEEVDEYVRNRFQLPRFVSLETDEFLFWKKLGYFLRVNRDTDGIAPIDLNTKEIELNTRDIIAKPNDLLNFRHYRIPEAPIVHVPSTNNNYATTSIRRAEKLKEANETNKNVGYEVTHTGFTPELVQQSILSQLASKKKNRVGDDVVVNLDKPRLREEAVGLVKQHDTVIIQRMDNRLEFAVAERPNQFKIVNKNRGTPVYNQRIEANNPKPLLDDLYDFN